MVLNMPLLVPLLKTIAKFSTLLMSLQFTLSMSFSNLKSAIEIEICNRNTRKISDINFSHTYFKIFTDYIIIFSLLLTLNMFYWHSYYNLNRIICTGLREKQLFRWKMFRLAFTHRALHCVKSVRIRSFSSPYFPAFGLNTERYYISLCIQSECGKIRTKKLQIWTLFTPC